MIQKNLATGISTRDRSGYLRSILSDWVFQKGSVDRCQSITRNTHVAWLLFGVIGR